MEPLEKNVRFSKTNDAGNCSLLGKEVKYTTENGYNALTIKIKE